MSYSTLADVVVVAHLAFILFVAVGGFLAWRWPVALWFHVPAVAWAVGIVTIGWDCPLTDLENRLREWGGEASRGGFVDRYIEGVVYPDRFAVLLQALVVAGVVASWAGIALRRRRGGIAAAPG